MAIKDWTSVYPTGIDTNTEQPDLTNFVDSHRASHLTSLRDAAQALETEVGSDLLESGSLRYAAWQLEASQSLPTMNAIGVKQYGNSLTDAVADIGATTKTLIIGSQVTQSANLTIPENITMHFFPGGSVSVDNGFTLTINGPIEAGLEQIFAGEGTIAGSPKIKDVYFQWWGAAGDNTTDDTEAVNKCLAFVSTNGLTARIPENSWFRTTDQLMLWGPANIKGASMHSCGFVLDAFQPVQVGSSIWINIGIDTLPVTLDAGVSWDTLGNLNRWYGKMQDFTVRVNDVVTDYDRLQVFQMHGAYKNWSIDRVRLDLSNLQETDNAVTIVSLEGNSTSPPAGEVRVSDGSVIDCEHNLVPSVLGGAGAVNLIKAERVLILNNRITGCTDDAVVFIDGYYCVADKNWVTGTKCRIGALGGVGHRIINNYIERVPDGSGNFAGSDMLVAMPNASVAGPSPEDCVLLNNITYTPTAATSSITHINLNGEQGTICKGNIMINDSPDPDITGMRVGTYTVVGWLDPKGVEASFGHGTQGAADNDIMRPRRMIIKDNVCLGTNPLTIEEYEASSLQIPGPIIYENNSAESFNIFGLNSYFSETNRGLNTTVTGSIFEQNNSRNFQNAKPFAEFFAEGIRSGLEVTALSTLAGKEFVVDQDSGGFLVRAHVEFDTALSGAGVTVIVYRNNFSTPVLDSEINVGNSYGRITSDDPADPDYERSYSLGSTFGVKLTGEAGLTGVYDAKITLYKITTTIAE
jgi:hypothetical protein